MISNGCKQPRSSIVDAFWRSCQPARRRSKSGRSCGASCSIDWPSRPSSRLAWALETRGDYGRAREVAYRLLELDPWREKAHQQVMRLLVFDGQRSAALAHYECCRRTLRHELGVEPSLETKQLYRQIRDDQLTRPVESDAKDRTKAPETVDSSESSILAEPIRPTGTKN